MNRLFKGALASVVGLFILGLFIGQLLVPIVAEDTTRQFPEVTHLVTPYTTLGIITLACFQLAAIVLLVIVFRAARESFFTSSTRNMILVMGLLCVAGFVIPAATAFHLLYTMNTGGPSVALGTFASLVGAAGFSCLTYLGVKAFDAAGREHDELGGVI